VVVDVDIDEFHRDARWWVVFDLVHPCVGLVNPRRHFSAEIARVFECYIHVRHEETDLAEMPDRLTDARAVANLLWLIEPRNLQIHVVVVEPRDPKLPFIVKRPAAG
jgi:hypothetical protein